MNPLVVADPLEELRWLEYVQRLKLERRGIVMNEDGDTGAELIEIGTRGGADALGLATGRIEPGAWADLLLIDLAHPSIAGVPEDKLASGFVFSGTREAIQFTMIGGVQR